MNNCLTCKNVALDVDSCFCKTRKEKIYILLDSGECRFYEEEMTSDGLS